MASGSTTPSSATTGETNGSATAVSTRSCTTCGRENTTDSRFCRHCGALLPAASSASVGTRVLDTPNGSTHSGAAPNGAAENGSLTAAEGALAAVADGEQLSPEEIEVRRARQLLDRSFSLSERGDLSGAILACRQAISLVPDLAEAHSMLGLLLERTGDTKGAIEAYEETLLLAPDSLLERDSLQRLRAQMPQQSATPFFRFDDSELFPETPGAANDFMTPAPNGVAAEAAPDGAAVAAASAAEPESADALPSTQTPGVAPAVATGAVVAATAAASAGPSIASDMGASGPVAGPEAVTSTATPASAFSAQTTSTAASTGPSVYSPVYSPAVAAAPASAPATPLDFGAHSTPVRPGEPWWQTARSRPSFYLRALPLTGVAVAGLMFMLWARNVADSRNAAVAPTYTSGTTAPTGTNTDAPTQGANANGATTGSNTPATTGTPTAPNGITGSNVPITNDWRTVPPNAPAVTGTTSTGATTGTGQAGATQGGSAAQPPARSTQGSGARPSSLPSIPPATIRPGSSGGAAASGGGPAQPFDGIPPARILNTPAAPEVVQAVPSGDGGATTSGGGPVNPAGSTRRGSVRVISRPSPAQAPARPENEARGAEDAARDDANNGRTGQAIDRTTAAINSSSDFDRAYRLQQRALLRLDAGDNDGAISDFRAAISAYNEQISRGTRVAEARRGISSCQSGLRLAQANSRR